MPNTGPAEVRQIIEREVGGVFEDAEEMQGVRPPFAIETHREYVRLVRAEVEGALAKLPFAERQHLAHRLRAIRRALDLKVRELGADYRDRCDEAARQLDR